MVIQKMGRTVFSLFTIFALGCVHQPARVFAADANPAATTQYFFGESKMFSPAGQPYGSSLSLIKRMVDPEKSRIAELVISIEKGKPAHEYETILDVSSDKFTMKDVQGTFEGSGILKGETWNWDQWTYEVKMKDGSGSLTGQDQLTTAGLVVKKQFFSPDGKLRVNFDETLGLVSEAAYLLLREKLINK